MGSLSKSSVEHSQGFAFRLGIALIAVVGAFAHPPAFDAFVISRIGETSWFWAEMVLSLAAPAVWFSQTVFAYRHYGKKWRWFLVGAPCAVFELMVLFVTFVMFLPN